MKDYTLTSVITTNGLLPLSGPGNAYYQKGDETYRLQANWIKGKKEGKAILYNSHNQVCAQLNYADDEINGDCVIRDDKGITRFHGNMVNGEKDGLCEEFDKNRVRTFYGYYEGGEKRPLLVPVSSSFPHLLKELSRSGVLLTISEYDPLNYWKNGHCFIFENNNVVRCDMMNQGKRQFTYATYTADTMTCFDEGGNKIYEGSYKNDVTSLFCKEGMGCEFDASGTKVYDGLFHNNKRCWKTIRSPKNPLIVLINDIKTGNLLFLVHVNNQGYREGDCNCYENGKLTHVTWWENGVEKYTRLVFSGDEATEYASDGITVVYVGHVRNNWREGEGTEYRDGVPSYVGQWHNGVPHGEGSLLNEFGDVMCEGEWRWGYLYTTEGWLDYASREVIQVKEPYKLPLWRQRGGRGKTIVGTIEKKSNILWDEMESFIADKGEWLQFVLCLAYAMAVLYYFTSMVFSMKITIISMVIELVLSLGLITLFACKKWMKGYGAAIPLQVWSWIVTVESVIGSILQPEAYINTWFLLLPSVFVAVVLLIFAYIAESSLFKFFISSYPPICICSLFPTHFIEWNWAYYGLGIIVGLIPSVFLLWKPSSDLAFRWSPLYSIIYVCFLMFYALSSTTFAVILVLTIVLISLLFCILNSISKSGREEMGDYLRPVADDPDNPMLGRYTPKPVPIIRFEPSEEEPRPYQKGNSIQVYSCLLSIFAKNKQNHSPSVAINSVDALPLSLHSLVLSFGPELP